MSGEMEYLLTWAVICGGGALLMKFPAMWPVAVIVAYLFLDLDDWIDTTPGRQSHAQEPPEPQDGEILPEEP